LQIPNKDDMARRRFNTGYRSVLSVLFQAVFAACPGCRPSIFSVLFLNVFILKVSLLCANMVEMVGEKINQVRMCFYLRLCL